MGVNAAGLTSKIESFEKLLLDEAPSIVCVQESKIRKPNQIKTESSKKYIIYELHRKNKSGGGLCIGVLKDLQPVWVAQGDDEVECLAVEVWVDEFPVRVVTAYGPQLGDCIERKRKFWDFLEREVLNATQAGAGFILQMDSNAHMGRDIFENDPNEQNLNGKLFCEFLEKLPHLKIVNTLPLCEGTITRTRTTTRGTEKSILDVFVTCDKILPYITKMIIDEKRVHALTNFHAIKTTGHIIESDHNVNILEINMKFSSMKQERKEIFHFKNVASQQVFKKLTSDTAEFSDCFQTDKPFEEQAVKWRKVLNGFFQKSFKKVRVTNKTSKQFARLNDLMGRRSQLKKKPSLDKKEEEEVVLLEKNIALECEERNRKTVLDNFSTLDGTNGNLEHQGVWQAKKKYFPKTKSSLPVGKKNLQKQLITNPRELKELYLQTFIHRLRKRPVQPGFQNILKMQEELFYLRLEKSKKAKSLPWTMNDLEEALKSLKNNKCRDPDGLIRELFKEEVIGADLKNSMLIMYNKIKETGIIPSFMRVANISAIYKGRGEVTDLNSDRGIFIVSIFRTILMKLVYKDKYEVIEKSMSDSNIGARKKKNIRNHIFIVNSVIHDVLSNKSKQPIDIMVLDYKQMFDSECLFEVMNDVYEAGVEDDIFSLMFEANKENYVAVNTPNGLSDRAVFKEIVMQGDVLAPLMSSLQVDTMGKECFEQEKHLYYFKDTVPVPPLGLVDDLFTISVCGHKTNMMNQYINVKTAMKRLQFGPEKCKKLHVGKRTNKTLCKDVFVGGWKVETLRDTVTGKVSEKETFESDVKMSVEKEQKYLGDIVSVDGKHSKNVEARRNKGLGIINQIMQILETVFFGKYLFEAALVLRSSLFLSSILLNSEAWVNVSDKEIRALERTDEILLSKILECNSNTSNTFKYLELGIFPIRFEVMKRKIIYLQYLLKQDENSMINRVLKAICDKPEKNDFVENCRKYLKILDINMSFEEIKNTSNWTFKKLVKAKTTEAGFRYLLTEKNKQSKISHIEYKNLKIQRYLFGENNDMEMAKFIFKARSKTLDIKSQRKWKYEDQNCVGCNVKIENENEILFCTGFGNPAKDTNWTKTLSYNWFYEGSVSDMVQIGKIVKNRLKVRQDILESK